MPFDILEPLSDGKDDGFSDYVGQMYLLWVFADIVRMSMISSFTQMLGIGVA